MSRSIDLFIDAPFELAELADQLGELTDTPLVPSANGERFVLAVGQTVARLGGHPFIDDGDLLLSRYPYVLSARITGDAAPADSRELALLRHVADLCRHRPDMEVLLVHDLQNRDKAPARAPSGGLRHPAEAGSSGTESEAARP